VTETNTLPLIVAMLLQSRCYLCTHQLQNSMSLYP